MGKPLVIIESPYALDGKIGRNISYACCALKDSLLRGEAPFASHILYTQPGILDDSNPEERKLGMEAGFEWYIVADKAVVYQDLGISSGMRMGIETAERYGIEVEYRNIEGWIWK